MSSTNNRRMTHNTRIINALRQGKTLTRKYAESQWGVVNLRAHICKLRDAGYPIRTVRTPRGKYAYVMPSN
jgi:hypothetical protein